MPKESTSHMFQRVPHTMCINRCGLELQSFRISMADNRKDEFEAHWPGRPWMEGKTVILLSNEQERPSHMPRGPAKRIGPGFINPAMAPARTRSVLLLADALSNNWLVEVDRPIRALDALCSTGVRFRRWRNEIPEPLQRRLRIHANDLDEFALRWAQESSLLYPPNHVWDFDEELFQDHERVHGTLINGIFYMQEDARIALNKGAYQWIDLDPFGSPIAFLDGAIQGIGRRGVLEVTATDTAALTGSSPSSQRRRYGAKGIVDAYAHDDAIRTLLGVVATTAAKHDRFIEPILCLFDGHHVRLTVLVVRGKDRASEMQSSIGWRVRYKEGGYTFVEHPAPTQLDDTSGPMWIAPLWNQDITARMSEARALNICFPNEQEKVNLNRIHNDWSENDWEYWRREICRSVRFIEDAAPLMSSDHLLIDIDDFAKKLKLQHIPKMENILFAFRNAGHETARVPYANPMIATFASIEESKQILRDLVNSHE
jgi:tRNA (guanine26-N2/guanine27-N2)-dimethyltransferase